jgi:hypothetical protein
MEFVDEKGYARNKQSSGHLLIFVKKTIGIIHSIP